MSHFPQLEGRSTDDYGKTLTIGVKSLSSLSTELERPSASYLLCFYSASISDDKYMKAKYPRLIKSCKSAGVFRELYFYLFSIKYRRDQKILVPPSNQKQNRVGRCKVQLFDPLKSEISTPKSARIFNYIYLCLVSPKSTSSDPFEVQLIESLGGENYISVRGIEPNAKKSKKCFNVIKRYIEYNNTRYSQPLQEAVEQVEVALFHKYSHKSMDDQLYSTEYYQSQSLIESLQQRISNLEIELDDKKHEIQELELAKDKQEIDLKDIIANKNDIISELRKTEKRNMYILEMYEDEQQYRQQVEKKFNQLVIQKRDDDEKYNNLLQQHKELQDLYDDSSKRLSEIATEKALACRAVDKLKDECLEYKEKLEKVQRDLAKCRVLLDALRK